MRAKRLSHGFYLAFRLGSTGKRCFCVAAISVITLSGCCFLVNFDLFLRFGGSLRP